MEDPVATAQAETPPEATLAPSPTTFQQNLQRLKLVQSYYSDGIMEAGEDYGVIPNMGKKPSLFKPGAEKLCVLFGLAPIIEVTDRIEDWSAGFVSYEVRVTLQDIETQFVRAQGVGHCNSRERKYKSQQAADVANTVLKMAKKRAFIDGVLSATGASAIFTQDIEDMAEASAAPQRAPTQQTRPPQQQRQPPQQGRSQAPSPPQRPPQQPRPAATQNGNGTRPPASPAVPSAKQPVVLATDGQRNSYEDDRAFAIWLGVEPEPREMPQRIKTETADIWKASLEQQIKQRLEERGLTEEEALNLLRAQQEEEAGTANDLSSAELVGTEGAAS